MVASAPSVAKRCVSCGRDVAQTKRMKDSQGRYWCVDCGVADQRKKAAATGNSGVKGGVAVAKGPGLFDRLRDLKDGFGSGGGGSADKGRLIKMLVVMGGLALFAAWQFMSHSH